MSEYTQGALLDVVDDTLEVLEAVATDRSLPSRVEGRRAIIAAINAEAEKEGGDGTVSAGRIRDQYPPWVNDKQPGAVTKMLAHRGWLVVIPGRAEPSGNVKSRNAHRLMPVYTRPRPIPLDALEPKPKKEQPA